VQPRLCSVWVHRTVWWYTGQCPVVHRTVSGAPGWFWSNWPLSGFRRRRTAKNHRTVRCAPDSVRCANGSKSSTVGCAKIGRLSAPDSEQGMSGGAPECLVHHPTEGKYCLPRMPPTAPSCLGAIKGTPRRMEDNTKHTLSILNHSHSIFAHSIGVLSDLGSVLVVNLVLFI
jgi:hypothetical protein